MEKEIYTPMERILIEGVQCLSGEELAAAIETKLTTNLLLELDEKLLKMEADADMMDGLKMEEWLL